MSRNAISVAQFFQERGTDIAVPDNEQLTLQPGEAECEGRFFTVEVRSFSDLQVLKLVPRDAEERAVRKAIADDDAEALNTAQVHLRSNAIQPAHQCKCAGQGTKNHSLRHAYRADLRVTYQAIRRASNPRLAEVLSEATKTHIAFDSMEAGVVRGFFSKLVNEHVIKLGSLLLNDIEIGANSTLFVTQETKLLYGNNLRIYHGGVLRGLGAFLRIHCRSAEGDLRRLHPTLNTEHIVART